MEELGWKNFDKIYNKKIAPKLEKFEQKRKETIVKSICFVLLMIFLSCFLYKYIIAIFLITFLYVCLQINDYKQAVKKKFYTKLFETLGFQYSKDRYLNLYISQICSKSDIFMHDEYDCFVDDEISGQYRDLQFSVYDTYVYYLSKADSDGRQKRHIVFKGLILATKINKPVNCEILIKENELLNKEKYKNKEKVKLESIDFEKEFEVYSNHQIEARYILTPSFMERLVKYKQCINKPVEVFIGNNISQDDNIFFFIRTNKNNFEIPLFKPLTDKKIFYNILKELTDALDVISKLKLEQNIGL